MFIKDLQSKAVQLDNYQATYLTLKSDNNLFRFDIIDKKEFRLKKHTVGHLSLFENHPLLLDYNENIVTAYINSKPDDSDKFKQDFKNAIDDITKGWRNWATYVEIKNINFTVDTFFNNVKHGTGKLFEAPSSIAKSITAVCDKHKVLIKTFTNELLPDNCQLLVFGDNYVIAKEFKLHIDK